jgi:hypothetical protein
MFVRGLIIGAPISVLLWYLLYRAWIAMFGSVSRGAAPKKARLLRVTIMQMITRDDYNTKLQ